MSKNFFESRERTDVFSVSKDTILNQMGNIYTMGKPKAFGSNILVVNIEYHFPMGDGDAHYCDVFFDDGVIERVFRPDHVIFAKPNPDNIVFSKPNKARVITEGTEDTQ